MTLYSGALVSDPRVTRRQTHAAFMSTADLLGCSHVNRRTIYRLIKSGTLPAVRIGGQWRFRRSDLNAWIDRQRTSVRQHAVKPTAGMHAGG